MLLVDLSNNNPPPDLTAFKQHGVEGIWFKATEGISFADAKTPAWATAAAAVGIRVGWYHFARPDASSPDQQAKWFCAHVPKPGRRDLRPVLDYETVAHAGGDEQWIRAFNQRVKALLGIGPLFYTYTGLVPSLHLTSTVGYGLWLANYGPDNGQEHPVTAPAPWKKVAAHQYTSTGRIGTYSPVDLTNGLSKRALLAHPVKGWL